MAQSTNPLDWMDENWVGEEDFAPLDIGSLSSSSSSTNSCCCDPDRCPDTCSISGGPVMYGNGAMILEEEDLEYNGLGVPWGQSRSYGNISSYTGYNGPVGMNWYVKQIPYLTSGGGGSVPSSVTIVQNATNRKLYLQDGTSNNYISAFSDRATLTYDSVANQFVYLTPEGNQLWFFAFDAGVRAGLLRALVDPAGNLIPIAYDTLGRMVSIARVYNNTETGFYYNYVGNTPQLTSVTLQVNGADQRRVNYAYYGEGDPNGLANDLKSAQVVQWSGSAWQTVKTSYYRYYTSDSATGFENGLKYSVGGQAYVSLVAFLNTLGLTLDTATDAQIGDYADVYFEYDTAQRVSFERTNGGTYSYAFTYENNSVRTTGFNQWSVKTTEVLIDGSSNVVYSNAFSQPLFKINRSAPIDGHFTSDWYSMTQYDNNGRVIQNISSAAISGIDETSGPVGTIYDSTGLITSYEYYTALDDQPVGYKKSKSVQQGSGGTPTLLETWDYVSRLVGSQSIYRVQTETVYQSSAGGGSSPAVTEYTYEWYTGCFQLEQVTTNLPTILTSQNGAGSSNSRTEVYDIYGHKTWLQDERGYLTNYTYDPISGGLLQQIQDVDATLVTPPPPNGWTTPAGGGLNLITDYLVDIYGRQTQSLGPIHSIDLAGTATLIRRAEWTVYQDTITATSTPAVWTASGYAPATGSAPPTIINPVSIQNLDLNGRTVALIQAIRSSTVGPILPTDTYPQSSWTRWQVNNYAISGNLASQQVYFLIPSSDPGVAGTNYNETDFAYDTIGRKIKTVTPAGTITRQVLNPMGWVLSTWVGTNDTGATPSDPTGASAPGNNMVQLVGNVYDGGAAGKNGTLTQQTRYASATDTRVTTYGYDFRNRKISADGEIDFYEAYSYDNVNRLTQTSRYNTSNTGNLVAQNATGYDNLGRLYQYQKFAVDPATGEVGNALTQSIWYDPSGNVILNQDQTDRGFTKKAYDGINRPTAVYQACNASAQTYATASTVAADSVAQQTAFTFDAASNLTFQVTSQRDHNATGTGVLNGPSGSQPQSRVSYVVNYPDALGRLVASANYGTNPSSYPIPYTTIPTSSAYVLVNLNKYDTAGNLMQATDPQGTVTQSGFDNLGRSIQKIENYQSGISGPDINKTTAYTYNANGQVGTLTANNSTTGNQVTQWSYGTTAADSLVVSNELLHQKIYPDNSGSSDLVSFGYNRLGQITQQTDQNGNVRQFNYDKLGRLTDDRVTTLGPDVDNSILRISRTYEVRGLLQNVTSYNNPTVGSGTAVNDVQLAYNSFQQLQTDYQSHSGAVNTSSTPNVAYAYANGSSNTVRLNTITYPNGRALNYAYGATNSIDDLRDRVTGLGDSVTTSMVAYTRFGFDRTVVVKYSQPNIEMTYIKLSGEPVGDGGDQYTGLDRFNRVVDNRWINAATSADVDRFIYGFSEASKRLWRENVVASEQGRSGFDEQYIYDGLYQVSERLRGNLTDGVITGTPVETEGFAFDPTGNWTTYDVTGIETLNQTRTHQSANEITSIAPSGDTEYDLNGNMTLMPQVDNWAQGQFLVWDAWNRLVGMGTEGSETVFATYQYDGLNRRTWKQSVESGSTVTRHFYYSNQWQVLEERTSTSTTADRQYVWGTRYQDDLVLRDRLAGTTDRLYALSDYFQTTSMSDAIGNILERYVYRAFGDISYFNADFESESHSDYDWTYYYGGYQLDLETSLYQVRNRYYHTGLGRWLSRDPLQDAELSQGTNLYWYVFNNAVNYVDPTGLISMLGDEDCTIEQDDECYTACQLAGEVYVECYLTFTLVLVIEEDFVGLREEELMNCICAPCGTMFA